MTAVRRALAASWVCASVLAASSVALADDEEAVAAQFFEAGSAAMARHDYKAAARSFEEAYHHVPRAAAIFDAALAWDEAKERAHAANAYTEALSRGELRGPQLERARTRAAELDKVLGVVALVAPAGATVTVGGGSRVPIPAAVRVEPGEATVRVERADGASAEKRVHVEAGKTVRVSVDLPAPAPAPTPTPAPARTPAPSLSPTPAPPPAPEPAPSGDARTTWGWIAVGTGAALGVTSIVLGVEALKAFDDFKNSNDTSQSDHDRAATFRTWTNVAWISAAVVGGTGLVLLLTAHSSVDVHPGNVAFRATF
jgi:hypothetical protein